MKDLGMKDFDIRQLSRQFAVRYLHPEDVAAVYEVLRHNTIFYQYLIRSGVEENNIIRFAFDSADDLYLIGESLIKIEKEKRGVDPEKFMEYIRSSVTEKGMYYLIRVKDGGKSSMVGSFPLPDTDGEVRYFIV